MCGCDRAPRRSTARRSARAIPKSFEAPLAMLEGAAEEAVPESLGSGSQKAAEASAARWWLRLGTSTAWAEAARQDDPRGSGYS